jgi:hypothetical protein
MPPADQPTAVPATLEGTVVSIEKSGEIVISAHVPPSKEAKELPQDTNWTVTIGSDTTIRVTGEAKPEYLKAGLMVQFTATIDPAEAKEKTIELKDKIQELKIVPPPARGRASTSAHKAAKKSEGQGAAAQSAGPQEVTGHLGPLHEHKWSVRFGSKTLQFELADDAKIHVEMTGALARRLISAGDKITVQGQVIRNKPGPCWATDVQVTLSHPLTAPKKGKRSTK